ncbi:MAG: WD40/YVTN/BNR-like repeat-containing protein [Vicinamibacterales bacterium]
MHTRWRSRLPMAAALFSLLVAGGAGSRVVPLSAQGSGSSIDPALLDAYTWRLIGPDRGGRSIAVSGVKGKPLQGYFGAVGGGLWKTIDGGGTWRPVTDGKITSSSVGAVAVSESNTDVVFIGMGESCIRGNIMPGDGVYRSGDAGATWTHVGFEHSDAISKIRIHPSNPDIVFVASFGLYSGPSEERGVYKSTDGGKTWRRVLFRDDKTGAVDLSIDPNNPNVIYAALWEAYRVEYQMSSGGPGSGLFKSTDGGETWTEITRNPGLPSGVVGRIGVAVSGADSNRVYALIENDNGGLFVSDDAGATWKLINDSRSIRQRAFYYTHIFADPKDKDTVYAQNTSVFRSTDGGKTMESIGNGTHGDHHDLWIDPDDPEHVIDGNDGGGAVTFHVSDDRRTWSDQDFPTAQFYHVTTTAHIPFHVCGAQQDNTTLCVPSDTGQQGGFGRIPPVAPYPVGGGEPGYIAADPRDPDVFFAGANNGAFLTRHNRRTGELKEVGAYPRFFSGEASKDVVERWQWTYPIVFSPVSPDVLFTSSQRVWKTTNGGETWEAISGDLTRHDPKTMQDSGGPITHDMNSPEIYATVFSLAPGKKNIDVIWAGSDDGLVHVTRDGGKTWTDITPPDMPEFGRVSQIDASAFDDGTAYVAVKKPLLGDKAPYIFRTKDFGQTWTKTVNGIGPADYVHAVREDPTRQGLLYAGTQHGVYISFDDGGSWHAFDKGLPDTSVTDIVVEDNALAIATHGRSFYVMDDISALRQFGQAATADVRLYEPPTTIRGSERATITYYLRSQPEALTLEFLDGSGAVVRAFEGRAPRARREAGAAGAAAGTVEDEEEEEGPRRGPAPPSMRAGINRFTWDLNSQPVVTFPGMILWGATTNGPMVLPGTYTVKLTVDGQSQTQPLEIVQHPLRPVSPADLQAQWDMALRIRDKVNEANRAVIRIRRIKTAIDERIKDAPEEVQTAGRELSAALSEVEEQVYQVRNQSNQDPLNFPIRTNNRLASLLRVVLAGEGRPTGNVQPIFDDLVKELQGETDQLEKVISTQLPGFNRMLERNKKQPIDGSPQQEPQQ